MSEHKTQIWLRPDQVELLISCLLYVRDELNNGTCISDAHKMAGRFTFKRIGELLALLGYEPAKKQVTP